MKRVRCYTSTPIVFEFAYVSWSDVWMRYKAKPGRKVYWLSPCLCSLQFVEAEIDMHTRLAVEHQDCDWSDEIKHYSEIKTALAENDFVARGEGAGLEVFTSKWLIDKAEAQRMLAWLLAQHGIRNAKLQWNKPKVIATPHYMPTDKEQEQARQDQVTREAEA